MWETVSAGSFSRSYPRSSRGQAGAGSWNPAPPSREDVLFFPLRMRYRELNPPQIPSSGTDELCSYSLSPGGRGGRGMRLRRYSLVERRGATGFPLAQSLPHRQGSRCHQRVQQRRTSGEKKLCLVQGLPNLFMLAIMSLASVAPSSGWAQGPVRLTSNTHDDKNPVRSPDGTKIALESNRDEDYEIYVMTYNTERGDRRATLLNLSPWQAWVICTA